MNTSKTLWHNLKLEETFKILNSSKSGLSSQEAKKRQAKFGQNILATGKKFSLVALFFGQFKSALVYVLLIAAIVSLVFKEFVDAGVIFAAVILNVVIGFVQEKKANLSLEKLKSVVKPEALVLRDGKQVKILSQDLVAGDIVYLTAGDRVPADIRLFEVIDFKTNEAPLTGESWPQDKQIKILDKGAVLAERTNLALMGTLAVEGRASGVVVAIDNRTEIGKIASLLAETKEERTPLQKNLDNFAKNITKVIVAIVVLIFILGLLEGQDWLTMFSVAVALAVSAIPEGLVIGVTMILTLGMQRILKQNGLVRKLLSAETLGSTTLICTDKTGTLTEGEMRVTKIFTNKHLLALDSQLFREVLTDPEIVRLTEIAFLCNNAQVANLNLAREDWEILGSPTEKALLLFGILNKHSQKLDKRFQRKQELPFDSRYKYMITRHSYDDKNDILFIKGAVEKVLQFSDHYLQHVNTQVLNSAKRKSFLQVSTDLSSDGLRVLAAAYKLIPRKTLDLAEYKIKPNDFVFAGLMALSDPLRPDTRATLQAALQAGIKTVIITGDNKFTAHKIANDLDLKVQVEDIIDGDDLLNFSDEELAKRITEIQVYARVTSADKLRIIKAWQDKGEVVAMTGDGVNDAPALKAADIGVVVASGSDVAKEVADLVLLDNNFKTIVTAIKQGRVIFDNVRKVILYLLSDSFSEIIIISVAILFAWPLPILTAQILWINLVSDGLPNLALTAEPEDPDILVGHKRKKDKNLLNFESKFLIAVISIITAGASLLLFWLVYQTTSNLALAQTVVFTALGLDSLFYVFSIRSLKKNIWQTNFMANKYLNWAVLFGLALQILAIYLPFFNKVLHTVPLGWFEWQIILLFVFIVILSIELIKGIFNRYYKSARGGVNKIL